MRKDQYSTVRINSLGSSFEKEDLDLIKSKDGINGIIIPKVSAIDDLNFVLKGIDQKQYDLYPCIESAKGLLNIKEILKGDSRIKGVFFAAEDYCADAVISFFFIKQGLTRTAGRVELTYPRQKVSSVAAAYGIESIDLVCIDFKSRDVLREECKEGKEWGFTGKQAIHPAQVDIIQQEFSPSKSQVVTFQVFIIGKSISDSKRV